MALHTMPKEGQTSTSRANRRAPALPIVFYQENPYAAEVAHAGDSWRKPLPAQKIYLPH